MGEGGSKIELGTIVLFVSLLTVMTVLIVTCPSELLPSNNLELNNAVANPYFRGLELGKYVDVWDTELWPGNAILDTINSRWVLTGEVGGWSLQIRWDVDCQWIKLALLSGGNDYDMTWYKYYLDTEKPGTEYGITLYPENLTDGYDAVYKVASFQVEYSDTETVVQVFFNYSSTDYSNIVEAFNDGHLQALIAVTADHVNLNAGKTDVWGIIRGLFTFSIPDVPWPIQVILSSVWWTCTAYLIFIFINRLVPFT